MTIDNLYSLLILIGACIMIGLGLLAIVFIGGLIAALIRHIVRYMQGKEYHFFK